MTCNMQIAYNWALASYHHYGQNHSETKAALAATEAADPQAWVPKLMAGLAYPSVSMAPAYVAGGFLEAEVRYCLGGMPIGGGLLVTLAVTRVAFAARASNALRGVDLRSLPW
jgi:hypothetical protein